MYLCFVFFCFFLVGLVIASWYIASNLADSVGVNTLDRGISCLTALVVLVSVKCSINSCSAAGVILICSGFGGGIGGRVGGALSGFTGTIILLLVLI